MKPVGAKSALLKKSREPVYDLKLESEGSPALSLSVEAWSRADAFWAAEVISVACSEEYDEFGLWEGDTYLYGGTTRCCWCEATPWDIALATQLLVLEHQELLLRSRSALSRSGRLLEDTARLRGLLSERGFHH